MLLVLLLIYDINLRIVNNNTTHIIIKFISIHYVHKQYYYLLKSNALFIMEPEAREMGAILHDLLDFC